MIKRVQTNTILKLDFVKLCYIRIIVGHINHIDLINLQ